MKQSMCNARLKLAVKLLQDVIYSQFINHFLRNVHKQRNSVMLLEITQIFLKFTFSWKRYIP